MARPSFLRPLSALLLLGIVPIGAACNGRVVSLGDTGDTLQSMSKDQIAQVTSTAPAACPSGFAHPNICCTSNASGTACGAWEDNPFRACDSGSTTYPDPLSCCQLSNPANCVDTPADAGPVPPPPPPYGCGYACPPGWWAQAAGAITPNGPEGAACCTVLSNGVTECDPQGSNEVISTPTCAFAGGGSVGSTSVNPTPTPTGPNGAIDAGIAPTPGPVTDAGTIPPEDAGVLPGGWIDDGGCGTYDAGYPEFDGGPASLCSPCPVGWSPDTVQPELCCSVQAGTTLCFSQATGSASSVGYLDGGTSVAPSGSSSSSGSTPPSNGWGTGGASPDDGGSPGPACSGTSGSCSCDDSVNGHAYAVDCYANSSGTITCSCTIDGVATSSTPNVTSCDDSTSVQSAFSSASGCGFP